MKIADITIIRFKSLKMVTLNNVSDLNIIIGPNSSGKTNFLEALLVFFDGLDFDSSEKNIGYIDNYHWYEKNTKEPIKFNINFTFNKNEIVEMIPTKNRGDLKIGSIARLNVQRELKYVSGQGVWSGNNPLLVTMTGSKEISTDYMVNPKNEARLESNSSDNDESKKQIKSSFSALIYDNLLKKLKSSFMFIPSSRVQSQNFAPYQRRQGIVPSAVIYSINQSSQNIAEDEKLLSFSDSVKETAENISDMSTIGNELVVREAKNRIRFPVSLCGNGYQDLISLEHQILNGPGEIFGIEQPDLHLHPQLIRGFAEFLKNVGNKKQVFITTHSSVFLDSIESKDILFAKKRDTTTEFNTIHEDRGEVKQLLFELGHKPSDLMFPNFIIFVEGESDKILFSAWAERLGLGFKKKGVSFIPIHGKTNGNYHLGIWVEAIKNTSLPYFMILDKDAEKESKELIKKGKFDNEENLFVLGKGSIEDYYPLKLLSNSLNQLFNLKLSEAEEKELANAPRSKKVDELMYSKLGYRRNWKILVAKYLGETAKENDIENEIKTILKSIYTATNI